MHPLVDFQWRNTFFRRLAFSQPNCKSRRRGILVKLNPIWISFFMKDLVRPWKDDASKRTWCASYRVCLLWGEGRREWQRTANLTAHIHLSHHTHTHLVHKSFFLLSSLSFSFFHSFFPLLQVVPPWARAIQKEQNSIIIIFSSPHCSPSLFKTPFFIFEQSLSSPIPSFLHLASLQLAPLYTSTTHL